MAGIKVGAHPLVVAVAMGLLGPSVLMEESDEDHRTPSSMPARSATMSALPTQPAVPEAPSDDEFARIEDLWHEVRTNI